MDILMRPRQGGKTYELVKRLVQEPDSVLITVHPRAPFLRDIVRQVLRELELPADRPRLHSDIDAVLERVFYPSEFHGAKRGTLVLVDGVESVLTVLLGHVDAATMDMPAEAGVAYRVHFEDQKLVNAWVAEDSYREERRRELQQRADRELSKDINRGVLYGGAAGTRGGQVEL